MRERSWRPFFNILLSKRTHDRKCPDNHKERSHDPLQHRQPVSEAAQRRGQVPWLQVFEEYAHTGLKEMIERCFRRSGDPLEELLAIADELRGEPAEGLEGIDPSVLQKLMGA